MLPVFVFVRVGSLVVMSTILSHGEPSTGGRENQ